MPKGKKGGGFSRLAYRVKKKNEEGQKRAGGLKVRLLNGGPDEGRGNPDEK